MKIEHTAIQAFEHPLLQQNDISLFIKREDLNHPEISGNKLRKLKYNLEKAKMLGKNTLLTFGGAYSNHIYATAAAGDLLGFQTIGIIRGEEHLPLNKTLEFASAKGMVLDYLDRTHYRLKNSTLVLNSLKRKYGDFYLIPEGGTNELAIKGCMEILADHELGFNYYCLSVGTGGTITGIIQRMAGSHEIIGYSSLKGDFLEAEINSLVRQYNLPKHKNWHINNEYHFGGYAKTSEQLMSFIQQVEKEQGLLIDPVYTGKALFGILDQVDKGFFRPGSKILFIHTGGLQGRAGFNL